MVGSLLNVAFYSIRGLKMAFEINQESAGGLATSSLGQKANKTRLKSLNSFEWNKFRDELKALNPNEREAEEDIAAIQEMVGRLNETSQPEL
jgi:hypothetical protein